MVIEDDPDIENSPLSGRVTRDGVTVDLQIYRIAGTNEGWTLEVVDEQQASTVWEDVFATDRDAYAEFSRTLETDGIRSFSEDLPPSMKH